MGGLGLTNLSVREMSLKAHWIVRLLSPTDEPWKSLLWHKLWYIAKKMKYAHPLLCKPNFHVKEYGLVGEIIMAWSKFRTAMELQCHWIYTLEKSTIVKGWMVAVGALTRELTAS